MTLNISRIGLRGERPPLQLDQPPDGVEWLSPATRVALRRAAMDCLTM
jgi:hypothetical protein